jgi:DNA polymerase-1
LNLIVADERRNLYLVDGSGCIFRAFFALPQLNNSRGLPTNATYGFIRMLLKLLKDARPTHIAVVFDCVKKPLRDDRFVKIPESAGSIRSRLIANYARD